LSDDIVKHVDVPLPLMSLVNVYVPPIAISPQVFMLPGRSTSAWVVVGERNIIESMSMLKKVVRFFRFDFSII
jgi:hypothetical protein